LALIAGVGLGIYLFTRMDEEIRLQAEQILAEQFPQLNVSVGGARLVKDRGIALYDLTISETSNTQLQNHLLVVDEIMLECDVQLAELAKGKVAIDRVVIRHPQLWISRRTSGSWNLESFLPLPTFGKARPKIVIKDAQIAIRDEGLAELPPFLLREINLTVAPASGLALQQPLKIDGMWGGPNVKRGELHAQVDLAKQTFRVATKFEQFRITPAIQAWIAARAPAMLGRATLDGRIDGNLSVQHHYGAEGVVPRFQSQLRLTGGRFEDPRLPRPLTKLSCDLQCDQDGMKIQELRGNLGSARVVMQLQRRGWNSNASLAMGLRVENLPLERQLYTSLPTVVKDQWDKYQPTGIVGGELQLTFDGKNWHPVAMLRGHELAFESDKFRYRLSDGSGTIRYTPREANQPAQLDLDLVGHGGGQPLKIVGQVFDPRPGATGWVEITGQNVDIEHRMIKALPEKARKVIRSMHPTGKFHVRWKLERKQLGQLKPDTWLQLELADCQVKYDKFPYPLSGIHGKILAENNRWTFRDLVSGGSRKVQCQGYLRPKGTGKELSLQFTGQQILLDDDLRQALPESVRKAWSEIRPRGRVDLMATVDHETGFAKPSIRATVHPLPESATIQPKFFPYLLEQVAGAFHYQEGQVRLSDIRARHGPTTIRTNGSGTFGTDGAWQFELTDLSVDRLAVRRDLIVAMPPKMQKLLDGLKPTGHFRLHDGTLRFSKSDDALATVDSRWDVVLDCLQTDLQVGLDLRNVHGSIRLVGEHVAGRGSTQGELALDSATFQDIQFTNIRGPLWVDETSCRLGRWATEIQRQPARRLTAQVYGGDLVGDGWATFDGLPEYGAQASLAGADLRRMMTERFRSQQPFPGKLSATINLRGRGRSLDNLVGDGNVKITDANIYELPVLVGMLKVLRNSTPNTTAFNQCDVKYRIQGRHIDLDQLDFLGDAVSLFGKGYTNFDHQLKLVFHGTVGRNDFRIPFVKNVFANASQQIMQMYVDGTVTDPQIHTQAFPGINNLIQQIQDDLDVGGEVNETREAKRGFSFFSPWRKTQ